MALSVDELFGMSQDDFNDYRSRLDSYYSNILQKNPEEGIRQAYNFLDNCNKDEKQISEEVAHKYPEDIDDNSDIFTILNYLSGQSERRSIERIITIRTIVLKSLLFYQPSPEAITEASKFLPDDDRTLARANRILLNRDTENPSRSLIAITPEGAGYLFTECSSFIDEPLKLQSLIKGEAPEKLIFNGQQIQLVRIFRLAHDKKMIIGTKDNLATFLCDYFRVCLVHGMSIPPKDLNRRSVYDGLTKADNRKKH